MTRRAACLLIWALVSARASRAQRTWPDAAARPIVGIDIGRARYTSIATQDSGPRFSTQTATLTGSLWIPLSASLALTGELPLSHLSGSLGTSRLDATVVGQPWVGIEASVAPGIMVETGVRPGIAARSHGTADTLALANGVAADYDHYEAWRSGYSAFRATIHLDREFSPGLFIGGLVGASAARPTGRVDEDDRDTDLYLLYAARVGYRSADLVTSVAFIGRAYPTRSGPNTEPTVNQIAVDLGGAQGAVRPIIGLRVYLDRLLRARTNGALALGVAIGR